VYKILFVCMGNICRSPSAEAVMKALVRKEGLSGKIYIDSAGTIAYHVGEPADQRMQQHAARRGYELTSIARQVKAADDFEEFDRIIAMDDDNLRELLAADPQKRYKHKFSKMTDYCRRHDAESVPDPYYGGPQGFEKVLDLLEDACAGLLDEIKKEIE